jgi:hypothetical protein
LFVSFSARHWWTIDAELNFSSFSFIDNEVMAAC